MKILISFLISVISCHYGLFYRYLSVRDRNSNVFENSASLLVWKIQQSAAIIKGDLARELRSKLSKVEPKISKNNKQFYLKQYVIWNASKLSTIFVRPNSVDISKIFVPKNYFSRPNIFFFEVRNSIRFSKTCANTFDRKFKCQIQIYQIYSKFSHKHTVCILYTVYRPKKKKHKN